MIEEEQKEEDTGVYRFIGFYKGLGFFLGWDGKPLKALEWRSWQSHFGKVNWHVLQKWMINISGIEYVHKFIVWFNSIFLLEGDTHTLWTWASKSISGMLCVRWIIAFLNELDQSTVEVIHTKMPRNSPTKNT